MGMKEEATRKLFRFVGCNPPSQTDKMLLLPILLVDLPYHVNRLKLE